MEKVRVAESGGCAGRGGDPGGRGSLGERGLRRAADPAVWELGVGCPLTRAGALMRGCEAEGSL